MEITINPTITVPLYDIHSQDSSVAITNPNYVSHASSSIYGSSDYKYIISLNPIYSLMIANIIINKEMSYIREKKCIDVADFSKIQQMLNSDEKEINNLAYSILEKHTKYVVPISRILNNRTISELTSYDTDNLNSIITRYLQNNNLNIEDIVK